MLKEFITFQSNETKSFFFDIKIVNTNEYILNKNINISLIREKWPYSNKVFCSSLDPDIESTEKGGADSENDHGEYYGLADYLQKKESKGRIEEEDLQEGKKWSCRYSHSRNLIIPEPKREVIYRTRWVRIPKPEKGWYISSLTNGINAYTRQPYQRYILRKLTRIKS